MAKVKSGTKTKAAANQSFFSKFDLNETLPQRFHILAVILVIIILFLIFLNPLFFGNKTFQSGDIIASTSMESYVTKDREGFSLWNPYIFCGMPAYAISTEPTWFNFIYMTYSTIRNIYSAPFAIDYVKWTFYLIILGITSFLLMRYLTKNTLVSLFTAIASSFSTGIIVFLYIGHVTKLTSLCMFPLIFLMLLRMQEKIRLIDFLILTIALQLFVQGFHVQIIFYTLFAVGIYFIYYFLRSVIKKQAELRNNILKSAGMFAAAAAIALLIQLDNITQVYEYTPYSTRGTKSIIEETTGKAEQSESEYYDYHTNWSFSPGEVLTFIVPSFYGFGNSVYDGPLTNGQETEVNTYFGQMPFVDVAMYMGVIVFFLGLFAVFTRWNEPFVQFLTILAGVSLLISFGKTFPILFDVLFYNLPYFDKFRVPSMILVLVQLSFPVLAGLGIMKIISLRNEKEQRGIKLIKNAAIVFSAVFLLSLLASSAIKGWFAERAAAGLPQQINVLSDYAAEMFVGDMIFAFVFLSLVFWSAHFYINQKISGDSLAFFIIILTIVDLWRIDARGAKYHDAPELDNLFTAPEYVNVIKSQPSNEPFRILNLKQDRSVGSLNNNSNFHAHFLIEDFYGYSGIKPRTYQDIIDVIGPANPTLWRMLNVKYLITQQAAQLPGFNLIQNTASGVVYENAAALPRIYFVNRVEKKDNLEVLNLIKNNGFEPREVAFVHDKELAVDAPDSTTSINIKSYFEDKITAQVNASGNNFLFFGNTYVPTGWKAYIDNNEVEIHQTNHGFMGIVVPKGNHNVEIVYAPESFFISKYVVLALSSLVLAGLVFALFLNRKKS